MGFDRTWGIYYKNRPTSVTATIITFSLSCNIIAGILIWWGGERTKKREEVERLLRIALEEEALAKIERRRRRAEEREEREKVAQEMRQLSEVKEDRELEEAISRPSSPASAIMQRFRNASNH